MLTHTLAHPQTVQDNIDSVFGTTTKRPTNNRGAGVIVILIRILIIKINENLTQFR